MTGRQSGPVDDLLAVLAAEREALLLGRFENLARIDARKEAGLARLQSLRDAGTDLDRVLRAVAHNRRLMQASLAGLNEARTRLAEARAARTGLSSYDAMGRPSVIGATRPRFERRA